jgi:hypothetical protein
VVGSGVRGTEVEAGSSDGFRRAFPFEEEEAIEGLGSGD